MENLGCPQLKEFQTNDIIIPEWSTKYQQFVEEILSDLSYGNCKNDNISGSH